MCEELETSDLKSHVPATSNSVDKKDSMKHQIRVKIQDTSGQHGGTTTWTRFGTREGTTIATTSRNHIQENIGDK